MEHVTINKQCKNGKFYLKPQSDTGGILQILNDDV